MTLSTVKAARPTVEIPAVAANAVCRMGTDELELELDANAEEVVTFEVEADLLLTAVALLNFAFVFLTRFATLVTNLTDMIEVCVAVVYCEEGIRL